MAKNVVQVKGDLSKISVKVDKKAGKVR